MPLSPGSRLGPYEILAPIGAGGMGEVWRAKDPRLGREVAIKVLPASFSADPDRLRRFEQEARAAGILNHPNLTAVLDIGEHEGSPYVVQELLEGETLRQMLAGGRLSARKTTDYATQIALGLAAAHEKGIVHRDLKPENVFVTKDGRIKILDFGLAKLSEAEGGGVPAGTSMPTATAGTEPGVVLGTLGYMSPEQVRGRPADARSDLFSFGAILYEMLAGQRPFRGDSVADTMSAILKEDPPDISLTNTSVPPGLERIVRHCLEKSPEQRFQSARDVAFDLEALSGLSGPRVAGPAAGVPRRGFRVGALVIAIAALAIAWFLGRRSSATDDRSGAQPHFSRLTFRRGNVLSARFSSDGKTVVYSAAWGDRPAEIFLTRIGSPESRPLGIVNANLLAVSPSDELAILQKKSNLFGIAGEGTLARVPLAGGSPRQIADDVLEADWLPGGDTLAISRKVPGKYVLELPLGKPVPTELDHFSPKFRLSPDGKHVALRDSAARGIAVVDTAGNRKLLTRDWDEIDTPVWHPSGKEIWFAAADRTGPGIRAVDLDGKVRTLYPGPDFLYLHDISKDGSLLVERELAAREIFFSVAGSPERDLSWLESSEGASLSNDCRTLLFNETAEGGGGKGSIYLRPTDGSPAVRLGEGFAHDLSGDGRWVYSIQRIGGRNRIVLLPTGVGEPRVVDTGDLEPKGGGFLSSDGMRVGFWAAEPGHLAMGYVLDVARGKPRSFTPEGLSGGGATSPDRKFIVLNTRDGRATIYPIDGGEARALSGLDPGDQAFQWSADGATLYVVRYGDLPLKVYRYDIARARKELWKELMPAERTGFVRIDSVAVSRDGRCYAYGHGRVVASDLELVQGLR
jgi:serine/threonine protein kinase